MSQRNQVTPQGVDSTGGQFAAKSNPESAVTVEPSWPGLTREVTLDSGTRIEAWVDTDGRYQDPADGSPAVRWFHPDGSVEHEAHWQAGRRQDPPDGSSAERWFRADGAIDCEGHYQAGHLQDPADGSPAVRWFHPDGTVKYEAHWQAGRRVS